MTGDEWVPTAIEGVFRRHLAPHDDERGAFRELWRSGWTDPLVPEPFVQANLSRSKPRVLRGMHVHLQQTDLWLVIDGGATVGLVDLRDAVTDPGWHPAVDLLELDTGEALLIPPSVAHGFYAPRELTLVYLVTREFDATDEHGFAWDDGLAALPWPVRAPILSARDQANPTLREAVGALHA